jgi:diguanylate cyclase (GGDEF)-like protein
MIDIDNFKKFNDYWGHSYGDECLKKVAECLKEIQEKREDIIGRYGGEEFIYIARNLNFEQALELGNHIRIEVEKLGLCYKYNEKTSNVTISMGGAIGKASDFKYFTNLIEISDKELYKAKDFGRNNTRLKKHCVKKQA